ncbi:coproporphyrinogen-III oxidase family protein [Butyrivibrio sp. JL13D10]|uniref:coproporphyrinogen-III oxidase family protein n=1 Tax=Butyrivibrio sp. JL13D10 TaxID=3236815 RepID=UPI0038B4CD40
MKTLGIYIHIPFCIQKCLYCDFLSFPEGREQQALYFDALKREIEIGKNECSDYEVVSVFFGGGTPTSVDSRYIAEIMNILKEQYNLKKDAEITIECNPGTADFYAFGKYREAGINRISIGLQSANDDELKRLGRIHNLKQFEECYGNARLAGFENVNIDLMSALPGQSLSDWERNLNFVCGLNPHPEHISAYSLIIEEGTPFYKIYGEDAISEKYSEVSDKDAKSGKYPAFSDKDAKNKKYLPLPDEDTEREMYHRTKMILAENGYHRYEISNYALDTEDNNYECLHNKRYWQGGDYIGFGLGAASYMKGARYHNTADFKKYLDNFSDSSNGDVTFLEAIHEDTEILDTDAMMEEFMFLGLRMVNGVSERNFRDRFGRELKDIYNDIINELINDELMVNEGDNYRLTEKGLDVSNYCMAKFLL